MSLLALARSVPATDDLDVLEEAVSALLEQSSGEQARLSLGLLLQEERPTTRAIIGILAQVAVEDADSEIQACGGEQEAQQRLAALLQHGTLRDALLRLLGDPVPLVSAAALRGLGALTRAKADAGMASRLRSWEPLTERDLLPLADSQEPLIRAGAIAALSVLPHLTAETRQRLVRALADPAAVVRAAAVEPAGRWLPEQAAPVLLACAVDPDPEVASRAVAQRVAAQDPRIAPVLLARLEAGVLSREDTCDQIRAAGLKRVSPEPLARVLSASEPPRVRMAAARALVEWVDPSCHPALVQALSLDEHTAYFAMLSLIRAPAAEAEPALRQLLGAPRLQGRSYDAAAIALGALGTPTAQATLLEAQPRKHGPRGGGASAAALCLALGLHPRPEHAGRLLALAGTENLYVCRVAAVSLGRCQSPLPEVRSALTRWLDEPDRVLSSRAALGLLLLAPADAPRALPAPPPARVASFEIEAASLGLGLRALGRALPSRHPAHVAARAWVLAHQDPLQEALDCYRGRGRLTGYATAYALWIADLFTEARRLLA